MLLSGLAQAAGLDDPIACLRAKMLAKGFTG